jgi:uncharacterized protein (DUF934 family)
MPLVKQGKIAADTFVHVADDAELPGDGAVLISAARFLEDPEALSRRAGKTGVVWPKPRARGPRALSRSSRSGRAGVPDISRQPAYSPGRLLRGRYRYEGDCAIGQVLRDQFVFMQRAGFDAFEVKKRIDAEAFAATVKRYSVFYQPTGDGRVTALNRRMQLRHSESASQ